MRFFRRLICGACSPMSPCSDTRRWWFFWSDVVLINAELSNIEGMSNWRWGWKTPFSDHHEMINFIYFFQDISNQDGWIMGIYQNFLDVLRGILWPTSIFPEKVCESWATRATSLSSSQCWMMRRTQVSNGGVLKVDRSHWNEVIHWIFQLRYVDKWIHYMSMWIHKN